MVSILKNYYTFVIMYNINYTIGLNEHGRPCIELPEDYEHRPEDKFLSIELTRYIIQDLLQRRGADVDEQTIEVMDDVINFLGQIGDEMAKIMYGQMKTMGEASTLFGNPFDIRVNSIEERDTLPDKNIFFDGKIFDRVEGLCVRIQSDKSLYDEFYDFEPIHEIYKLVDGITNEHWIKI